MVDGSPMPAMGVDPLGSVCKQVAERLVASTGHIGELRARAPSRVAAVSRAVATEYERMDHTGRERVRFQGVDKSTGNLVVVRFEQVRSDILRDADGRPIGVSFPTQPIDEESRRQWAGARTRTSDTQYSGIVWASADRSSQYPDWLPPEPTPWSEDVLRTGMPPVYVAAHAGPYSFAVDANLGTESFPRWTLISADGRDFGDMLINKSDSLEVLAANPVGPVVHVACNAGRPYGSVSEAAAAMHDAGIHREVHGSPGLVGKRYWPKQDMSELGVEVLKDSAGGLMPAFTTFRPPDGGTPWDISDTG